ncbi:hypothetical protein [Nonomuraea sp. NPDC049709]|uniref:hypothetical protein n=1 Tax=Nonomuraea sp. NPDC049709 TaxID=3154736 RepID=UPI00341D3B05
MTRRRAEYLCGATHTRNPDQPRTAADGINLCPGCRTALDRHLHTLPELHADVLDSFPTSGTGDGPPVTGSREPPLPYNPAAGDWLAQLRHDLGWLTTLVATSRGITPPQPRPAVQCVWLATHAEWLAAQPDAGPYKDALAGLVGRGYAVVDPARRPLEIGPCVEQLVDEGPCDGTVWVAVRRDGDTTPSVMWCDTCTLELDTTQWNRFGKRYERTTRERMAG